MEQMFESISKLVIIYFDKLKITNNSKYWTFSDSKRWTCPNETLLQVFVPKTLNSIII